MDPLIHHARHFRRAICRAFLKVPSKEWHQMNLTRTTAEERAEQCIFKELLKLVPSLERHLMDQETTEEEINMDADMIQKGTNRARSDGTKGLKYAASIINTLAFFFIPLDWFVPTKGLQTYFHIPKFRGSRTKSYTFWEFTDSEWFYNTILALLEDPNEKEEVDQLLTSFPTLRNS
ncbi:hypothetical protein SERLA73DRAFT_157300 [Serpula lacrymans var. lacrymans S7.3]|uniref:Uncharacterized protein n=1 Tax=Serpula lacrymans var. lacrymans (strain S7.3) TaxID=936435 RepID=F8QID8_SERL3|nr:hypothetical protein SERLA73DRAFT_157300 [Serpula lacrymans var. lacrymans S7.3]